MKAVIVAGGKGKRLGKLTQNMPKPMLKIGDKPILGHQIDLLKRYGISDIIICTGYLSKVIEKFISEKYRDENISCSLESTPLGTAGCVKELEPELGDEHFIVLYGDIMLDINASLLTGFHFAKESEATMLVHPNDHPYDSDLIVVDKNNKILSFLNKPHPKGMIYRNLVNAGVYVLSPAVFDYIESGKKQDFAQDIFPAMVKDNRKLYAYNTPEYIKDVGTIDRIESVTKDYSNGKIERLNLDYPRPAVFLDRDGVINKEGSLNYNLEEFELLPNTVDAIIEINKTDFLAIVVTNQPSVAKGFCSIKDIEQIHRKMETLLGNQQAKLDGIYFCPHHPQKGFPGENPEYKIECGCRKPKAGMIEEAKRDFNIDLKNSFMVGDRTVDIKTAKNAGVKSIAVRTGYSLKDKKFKIEPDCWADDLADAVDIIKKGEMTGFV